jgi:diaminopimelate decarboxylase
MTQETDAPAVRRLADWSAADLQDVADTYGTPTYVYDLDRVRENYRRFADAFPDARVCYAAKANTSRPVLAALADAGAGVECASAGEVRRALDAGFPAERVVHTAVNPPGRDLDHVATLADGHPDLTVTAGARDTIDRLADRGYDGRLCVRVTPGVEAGHHDHVRTGADRKFGVAYEDAETVVADARDRGFDVVGVHAHAGSGISGDDLTNHRELVAHMGDLAGRVGDLEFVDVGGGFGVPYRPDEAPLDLDAVADATRDALGDVDADLAVEPGRYLVADAGVLLARVNTVKPGEPTVVGVDAGINALLRPALYDAHHEVRLLADGRPDDRVAVAGPLCESGDVLAADRALARPERGDVLAVGNAGAYGFEMASQYNSRPRPAVVVREGGEFRVARRRETLGDVTAREVDR